jgi:16S rRNA processing protein RimM
LPAGPPEDPPELVVVGRVGGAYGVGGAIRVTSATHPKDNILHYRPWWLGDRGAFRPVTLQSVEPHGEGFVARLAEVRDRDAAQALKGREVAVPRSVLPALDGNREFYWRDLIGLAVVNFDGTRFGTVRELIDTGAHDVLVVAPPIEDGRDVLIPFVDAFVSGVDLVAGEIRVDWQEPV